MSHWSAFTYCVPSFFDLASVATITFVSGVVNASWYSDRLWWNLVRLAWVQHTFSINHDVNGTMYCKLNSLLCGPRQRIGTFLGTFCLYLTMVSYSGIPGHELKHPRSKWHGGVNMSLLFIQTITDRGFKPRSNGLQEQANLYSLTDTKREGAPFTSISLFWVFAIFGFLFFGESKSSVCMVISIVNLDRRKSRDSRKWRKTARAHALPRSSGILWHCIHGRSGCVGYFRNIVSSSWCMKSARNIKYFFFISDDLLEHEAMIQL